MLYEFVEPLRLMIMVHGEKAPAPDEWDPYAAALHHWYGKNAINRVFVFADGPGPSAMQREKIRYQARAECPVHTAVITHSLVARGIVTALSWFFEIRPFPPGAIDQAFEYLSLPRSQWLALRTNIAQKRVRLTGTGVIDESFELSETIGALDDLVTERLPKLRARVQRARGPSPLK